MHLFPMNLLRLICSLQNSTSFLAQAAELPSHRFLGSPPRPDEPVCVNPFTIYYSGFRFICQALRQTFLRNFRLFFFFHRFSTAVLGRLHGFFVGFWRFLQRQFCRLPQRSGAGRHSGNAAAGSVARVLPLLPEGNTAQRASGDFARHLLANFPSYFTKMLVNTSSIHSAFCFI